MEEDAKEWWARREMQAEKDMSAQLSKRMEAQRAQIHSFKLEQHKYEHELQLRVSKYGHDRKLLSEHNIELQEALSKSEERLTRLQHEADLQAARIVELEGALTESEKSKERENELEAERTRLLKRVEMLEKSKERQVQATASHQASQNEDLIGALQQRLAELVLENEKLQEHASGTEGKGKRLEEAQAQTKDLEKTVKQREQTIQSLKAVVERQEVVFQEKLRAVTAKYDQAKQINVALQKQLLEMQTK